MERQVYTLHAPQAREFSGPDGTTWREWRLAWPGEAHTPGQYLMAAPGRQAYSWPSPLMIQRREGDALILWLHPNSPLYAAQEGEPLRAFGPGGTPASLGGNIAVVCDARGLLLCAPYLAANQGATLYLYGQAESSEALPKTVQAFTGWQEGVHRAEHILLALPLADLAGVLADMPQALKAKAHVFAGVRMGCGTGACRGCFIAGGQDSWGIAVCQKGPFLPLNEVDFQRDQDCLAHYV